MPVSPSAALSRRHLLLAGAVGLSSLAALGSIAPARAEDVWTEEFMTRPETREGFLLDDMDEWQVENAKFIIAVIKGHGLDEQAATITLATAMALRTLFSAGTEVSFVIVTAVVTGVLMLGWRALALHLTRAERAPRATSKAPAESDAAR